MEGKNESKSCKRLKELYNKAKTSHAIGFSLVGIKITDDVIAWAKKHRGEFLVKHNSAYFI